MSSTQQALNFVRPAATSRPWRPPWRRGPHGPDIAWAGAFCVPYIAVFITFVAYPVGYGLWFGSNPARYAELLSDPHYPVTVVNTLLLVGVGVNLKLFLAFVLSGFFMHRSRWVRALLVLYMLPWALPMLPSFLSLHWMFIGYGGFMNSLLEQLFGIEGPTWFSSWYLSMAVNIGAYIWKWMPFWTLVFLAGRMAIPADIYEAAAVDGATGLRRFSFVTFPLLANLYLVSVLLSTLWTIGDFSTSYFVSSGAPALFSEVLATYGFRMAFDHGHPALGLAAMLSALPLLIPLTILLMRRLQMAELQL